MSESKQALVIARMANGFMVYERQDLVANAETYVFNRMEDLTTHLRKELGWEGQ